METKIGPLINVDVDCYQCGTILSIPFRLDISEPAYAYCPDCQEGVEVTFYNNALSVSRSDSQQSR